MLLITSAKKAVSAVGLTDRVKLASESIYEATSVEKVVAEEGLFDAGYFSGSLIIMPDPVGALMLVGQRYVKKGGRVYITQAFQRRGFPGWTTIKPLLKHITTIDFGQVCYESQLDALLVEVEKKGMKLISNRLIEGSLDNPFQGARCVVLQV